MFTRIFTEWANFRITSVLSHALKLNTVCCIFLDLIDHRDMLFLTFAQVFPILCLAQLVESRNSNAQPPSVLGVISS